MNKKSTNIAKIYDKLLDTNFVKSQKINSEVLPVYHVFSVVCKINRDELALFLKHKGIQTNIYYKWSLFNQKGYTNLFKNKIYAKCRISFPNQ